MKKLLRELTGTFFAVVLYGIFFHLVFIAESEPFPGQRVLAMATYFSIQRAADTPGI